MRDSLFLSFTANRTALQAIADAYNVAEAYAADFADLRFGNRELRDEPVRIL
ncbi:hypothetical protein [Caballeronia sp. SL2Y3]|uniref:hypothetical protein n=1 Tax=Caballeronia sp. SL2Y3 TaxID=2878151 RepID=UPI001FCFC9EC|nr:hypothetical protein [Caballeronia sp. SL2Y3]